MTNPGARGSQANKGACHMIPLKNAICAATWPNANRHACIAQATFFAPKVSRCAVIGPFSRFYRGVLAFFEYGGGDSRTFLAMQQAEQLPP